MRILVVGAGAVGGYFGGRLVEKGEDVTFLVRERRKEILDNNGLTIESVHGDVHIHPKTIVSGEHATPFDVVILSTKAYQLDQAMEDIKPYVGKETMILPLLNGISHIDRLIETFSEQQVIGGLCFVEATLNTQGEVIQSSSLHELVFGERNGEETPRILDLQNAFSNTNAEFRLSHHIKQEMWHKYLFISTLSGVTSLFRSPIGHIREDNYGSNTIKQVLSETGNVMRGLEAPLKDEIEYAMLEKIRSLDYTMKSSLQRDMEKELAVEADHLYGYLLHNAEKQNIDCPKLENIYANLKIYESNQ